MLKQFRHQLALPHTGVFTGSKEHKQWLAAMAEKSDAKIASGRHAFHEFELLGRMVDEILVFFDLPENARNAISNYLVFNDFYKGRPVTKYSIEISRKNNSGPLCSIKIFDVLTKQEQHRAMREAHELIYVIKRERSTTKPYRNLKKDIDLFLRSQQLNSEGKKKSDIDLVIELSSNLGSVKKDKAAKTRIRKSRERVKQALYESFSRDTFGSR
jgi:hypothetical protein